MALSEKQKKHLRRLGHPLSPIVMLGNAGLTPNVVKELERALADHELVKVSARVGERSARDAALDELAKQTSSEIVQRIGNVGVFYRRSAQIPKRAACAADARYASASLTNASFWAAMWCAVSMPRARLSDAPLGIFARAHASS